MPRKRIAKGRASAFHKSDGKLKKWNTISDIPMDEEDQFHASKDKILLDRDHNGNGDDDGDDDEVFALKGLDHDSEEDEGFYGYEDDEVPDGEAGIEKEVPATKKKSKHSRKLKKIIVESPEEREEAEAEEEEGWGRGRAAYYSSNADQLESDDEEGNELEEKEAIRLQDAIRKEMTDDDFGLNDNLEVLRKDDVDDIVESTPSVLPSLPTDKKGLLHHLEKTSPESLALARDWDETARNLQRAQERISKIEAEDPDIHLGMIHLHYQVLLSYSTMLAFYLHLRSSAKYAQRPSLLQSHPILQRLLTLKQSLVTLEDLDFAGSDSDSEDDGDDGSMTIDNILGNGEQVWEFDSMKGLEPNELAELLEDAVLSSKQPEKADQTPPKKKRKTAQDHPQPAALVFDLVEPQFVSSKSSSSREPHASDADAYGEMTALHSADLADKSARKKSLRFHTSKIDSASARRQGARNQAVGGDDDLPYRQRKKEKDAQLVKEATRKLNNQGGEDLNDEDPEPRVGEKRSRKDEDEADADESPDDYYELVKNKSKEKKEKKKVEYEEANGRVRIDLEEGGDAGPRSLTRAILKNRGLTPHRPKSVRNPRVKKRMRYEKAKKTISSQKAIYKGGLSQTGGRYEGEKSGISKVVKSVRLG